MSARWITAVLLACGAFVEIATDGRIDLLAWMACALGVAILVKLDQALTEIQKIRLQQLHTNREDGAR